MAAPYGWLTPDNGFLISVWFRREQAPSDSEALVYQTTSANIYSGIQFAMYMNSGGKLSAYIRREGTANSAGPIVWEYVQATAGMANDGNWHNFQVRLSYSGYTATAMVDGQIEYIGTFGTPPNWNPGYMAVGGGWYPRGGANGYILWNGELSHVTIWNNSAPDVQMLAIYAAGAGATVYYGDDEVTRLHRILDWAEVPEQSRELDAPLTVLQGVQPAEENALSKVHETGEAVSGLVFADGQSRVVYHNRRRRYGKEPILTLSESTGSAPETQIEFVVDDTRIYNDITGQHAFGGKVRLIDPVSIAAYGRKMHPGFSLPLTSIEEVRNAVAWMLSQYSREQVRISAVTFAVESSEKLERLATGLVQIGDVIVLDELPDPSPVDSLELFVEKIDVDSDFVNKTWRVTLQLSPREISRVAILGQTKLGEGAVIGY